jgi:hypothetical protein
MSTPAQDVKAPGERRTLVGAALIAVIGFAGICTMSPALASLGAVMVAAAVRGAARFLRWWQITLALAVIFVATALLYSLVVLVIVRRHI